MTSSPKNPNLLPASPDAWDWQLSAACRGMDTSNFYSPDNERRPARLLREERAKEICVGCHVVNQCLKWALQTREPYGVWGGFSAAEREALFTPSKR